MASDILKEIEPGKLYSSSALRAARHFWTATEEARALELAQGLQDRAEIQVVAVLDGEGKARGIIPRERLFSLLSKPFGREILGSMRAAELAEIVPVFDAHSEIYAVAQAVLKPGVAAASVFQVLTDADGLFRGVLSSRDLAEHLSRMTQDDIDLAARLQERLQAGNESIGGDEWRFEAWSRPAKGIGGDFYYTKKLSHDRVFIALCDVSGKGVAASLIVAMVWGMLRMYDFHAGLRSLILRLNEAIVGTFHLEKYLTGFFMVFEPSNRELVVADMGHSHCLLVRGDSVLTPRNGKPNLPVGIESSIDPTIARWRLERGDRLLVYSDGLTEQENEDGAEYGVGRLVAALRQSRTESSLAVRLCESIDRYRGRTPQQDDMSFVYLDLLTHRP